VSKNSFNVVKASFWLIASIIWAQIIFSYGVAIACAYMVINAFAPVGACKDNTPSILELLTGGLAVALAFSGKADINSDDKDVK
jgi:hypothetical protein